MPIRAVKMTSKREALIDGLTALRKKGFRLVLMHALLSRGAKCIINLGSNASRLSLCVVLELFWVEIETLSRVLPRCHEKLSDVSIVNCVIHVQSNYFPQTRRKSPGYGFQALLVGKVIDNS